MSTIISLPDGHHAVLRDIEDITVEGERAIDAALFDLDPATITALDAARAGDNAQWLGVGAEGFSKVLGLPDARVFALLESWDYPPDDLPFPQSVAAIKKLPARIYRPIKDAVDQAYKGAPADPGAAFEVGKAGLENPDSPTGPSADSGTSSAEVARRPVSDRTRPRGGTNTGTDVSSR